MTDETPHPPQGEPTDQGLRTLLRWTFVALIGSVLFSVIAVYVVRRLFGP